MIFHSSTCVIVATFQN